MTHFDSLLLSSTNTTTVHWIFSLYNNLSSHIAESFLVEEVLSSIQLLLRQKNRRARRHLCVLLRHHAGNRGDPWSPSPEMGSGVYPLHNHRVERGRHAAVIPLAGFLGFVRKRDVAAPDKGDLHRPAWSRQS